LGQVRLPINAILVKKGDASIGPTGMFSQLAMGKLIGRTGIGKLALGERS